MTMVSSSWLTNSISVEIFLRSSGLNPFCTVKRKSLRSSNPPTSFTGFFLCMSQFGQQSKPMATNIRWRWWRHSTSSSLFIDGCFSLYVQVRKGFFHELLVSLYARPAGIFTTNGGLQVPFTEKFFSSQHHVFGCPTQNTLHIGMTHAFEQARNAGILNLELTAQPTQFDAQQPPQLLQIG